jgi:hypothetical protein
MVENQLDCTDQFLIEMKVRDSTLACDLYEYGKVTVRVEFISSENDLKVQLWAQDNKPFFASLFAGNQS